MKFVAVLALLLVFPTAVPALTEQERDDLTEFSGPGWRDDVPSVVRPNVGAVLREQDENRLEKPPSKPWKPFPAAPVPGAESVVVVPRREAFEQPKKPESSVMSDIVACLPEAVAAFQEWWTPENREKLMQAGEKLLEDDVVREVLLALFLGFAAVGFVLYLLIDLVFSLLQAFMEGTAWLGAQGLRLLRRGWIVWLRACGASSSKFFPGRLLELVRKGKNC